MANSTIWSLMALSMSLISFAMHRDISANIFLASFFVIQGMRAKADMKSRHYEHLTKSVLILSIALGIFATWAIFSGADLGRPANFGYRYK